MAEWYTVEGATPEEATEAQERLVAAWGEAPIDNLEVCGLILDVAREQVEAYAPNPEDEDDYVDGTPIPIEPKKRYVYAQLQQADNLWTAGRANVNGDAGEGMFVYTPRPLDKTIRGIIRPTEGVANVGN